MEKQLTNIKTHKILFGLFPFPTFPAKFKNFPSIIVVEEANDTSNPEQ
jgi:hypothetical protein